MTGKDFLKLLLCIYEYDTDIEIETERNFGDITYDVTATNKRTLDVYHGFDEGLYSAVYSIINYMTNFKEHYMHTIELDDDPEYSELAGKLTGNVEDDGHSLPPELSPAPSYKWNLFSVKEILDDEFREKMRKKWIAEKEYHDKCHDFFKEFEEKIQNSMPCRPHGKCKDRVWRDDCINDYCELQYTNQCQKLREWSDDVKKLRVERNKEWDKYCETNGIINPYKN